MLETIGTTLTQVISWTGSVITALTSSSGALYPLLPLFAVGISVSAVLLGVKMIKSLVWGA